MNIHRALDSHVGIATAPFSDTDLDAVAERAGASQAQLRAAWFGAAADDYQAIGAKRADGSPLIALPFEPRALGPVSIMQVPGSYWPFRSFPIAEDIGDDELAAFLADPRFARTAGRVWRWGPVYTDDPSFVRMAAIAPTLGWHMIRKPLGQCYELDLAALRAAGPWPKGSEKRKSRARERKLGADGAVEYRFFEGPGIDSGVMDAMAHVEAHSWLAGLDGGGDTKFHNPAIRSVWANIIADADLAPMIFASLMSVGDTPIAFTFGLEIAGRRYYVANNYHQDFAKFGPGKLLLYKDFERATERGIDQISWGAGDAGYKSDMGAVAGPEIVDLLFVRGRALAALLRPLFQRSG